MTEWKRITVSLPVSLLEEVDKHTGWGKKGQDEFLKEAVCFYLAEKRKSCRVEQMREGYREMAKINLALAKEFYACEGEADLLIKKQCL